MRPLLLASLAALLLPASRVKAQDDAGAGDPASIVSGLKKAAASVAEPPAADYTPPLYVQQDGWVVFTVPDPRTVDPANPKEGETLQLAKGETVKLLGRAPELPGWIQVEVNRQEYKDGKLAGNTKGWVQLPPDEPVETARPAGLVAAVPEGSRIPTEFRDLPPSKCRGDFIDSLKTFQGVPYVWGGTSHKGVDCSGLVVAALLEAGCVRGVPRTAADQQQASVPLSGPDQLQPGDLIFESKGGAPAHHVYVYFGKDPSTGDKIIEALQTGTLVTIKNFRPGTGYGALLPKLEAQSGR